MYVNYKFRKESIFMKKMTQINLKKVFLLLPLTGLIVIRVRERIGDDHPVIAASFLFCRIQLKHDAFPVFHFQVTKSGMRQKVRQSFTVKFFLGHNLGSQVEIRMGRLNRQDFPLLILEQGIESHHALYNIGVRIRPLVKIIGRIPPRIRIPGKRGFCGLGCFFGCGDCLRLQNDVLGCGGSAWPSFRYRF